VTVATNPPTEPAVATPARFEPDPGSIAAARRHIRRLILDWHADELLDDVLVLVSELATNAVVHAGTAFEVGAAYLGDGIRVEVRDSYPARGLPAVLARPEPGQPSGRGLLLCAALSSAWGVEYTPTVKTVWCRLDLPGGEPSSDAAELGPLRASGGLPPAGGLRPSGGLPGSGVGPAPGAPPAEPAGPAEAELGWASFSDADLVRLRFDDMLQRAAHRACDAFGGDAAYLQLVGGEGLEPRLATSGLAQRPPGAPEPPGSPGSPGGPDTPAEDPAGQPALDPLPAVYPELAAGALPVLAGAGMRSAVVAQLLAEGRPIGQLCVASAQPGRFSGDDAGRLQRGVDRLALAVASRRVAESSRRQRTWLAYLAEASDLLTGTLEPQMTIAMLAQLVVPRLASWCAVRLYDERGGLTGMDYTWHADEARIDAVRQVLASAPAELPGVAGTPGPAGSLLGGLARVPVELRHDIAVALVLRARGRRLGVAVLGRPDGDPFESESLSLAEEVVRRAALALDNALLYRLHRATSQALQRSLLPAALPSVPGLDIGVAYQAAGEGLQVGGDFYDLFALDDNRWRFAVGDVAGNGPEAAGDTGLARHTLRLLGRQHYPPAEVVAQLNRAILDQRDGSRFLTLLHGEITPRVAGGMRVELVVAGHPLPYLLSPGRADQVGTPQPLLGVLEHVPYRADTILLAPGETLLCLTDGVTERRGDGRILGEDDLHPLLVRCAGMSASAVAAAIQRAVLDYAATPPRDDMAVLVLRTLPTVR
jgi:serine phosphatase RsbU (regulator of sigma subunit)/anti-sigma regulatory factor (Ser/Thr protein kinase)